jgi:hypothetical protein
MCLAFLFPPSPSAFQALLSTPQNLNNNNKPRLTTPPTKQQKNDNNKFWNFGASFFTITFELFDIQNTKLI